MAACFDEWDGVKKIEVVFEEMDDSEVVMIMTERQGQIRKKIQTSRVKIN